MKVTIIGTGYVGLTTGVCLAYLGHEVTCLDSDEAKIESLTQGVMPIYEPRLAELCAEARPMLRFTTSYPASIPDAEVIFIAVGTPPLASGAPDLSALSAAAECVGANVRREGFTVIVNKSTVPIGCGNWVGAIIREAFERRHGARANGHFAVASNPEFLREGSALHDSLYPNRIVIGAEDQRALDMLHALYRPILQQSFTPPAYLPRPADLGAVPLVTADVPSAELIKYAANAFLALKISYINEVGQLAERVGADIAQVAKGIGLDSRIGTQFLQAGLGWGGSCFGKDTAALIATANEYGLRMPIVEATREINRRQRERVLEKLLQRLKILKGCTIGLLGLAFKPHTDDLRESPALDVAARLVERGARVRAHDPAAMPRVARERPDLAIACCASPEDVAREADAVVLATEWPEYQDLPWERMLQDMRRPVLLDARNFLDRARMVQLGFEHVGF